MAPVASRAERSVSFGAIADNYDRLRPPPPAEAVDWLVPDRLELAVDVGAGTGLLTRALAHRAGHVVAVEPDERMRAVLRARSPGVDVVAGRGESIPLLDARADAVLASSAWHWMEPQLAVPEIGRVLRDGGRLGLIWTGRDRETEWLRVDEWFRGPGDEPEATHPRRDRVGSREVVLPDPAPFVNIETTTFWFTRVMAIADVVDMLTTYSRVITAAPEVREAGRARAGAALASAFPGASEVDVPMRSHCWRADRAAR